MEKRIPVEVGVTFSNTGNVKPNYLVWTDGEVYFIDSVTCSRPAAIYDITYSGIVFLVEIRKQKRLLYYEPIENGDRLGRWYVRV